MNMPFKVLIVEDEMIIAAKISMHLTNLGYEVSGIIPRGGRSYYPLPGKPTRHFIIRYQT